MWQLSAPGAEVLASLQRGLLAGRYLRTLNFHNLTSARLPHYEQQLKAAARVFCAVSEDDLARFFETKRWHKPKPGLLPVFYEGYRSSYDHGAPLAERHGFIGWFFLPTDFLSAPPDEQRAFAAAHHLGVARGAYPGGRVAMTWDEVRDLARRGHVIASHTCTHAALTPETSEALVRREIVNSQEAIEGALGRRAHAFAWLLGGDYGLNPAAHPYLAQAGYRFLFSNFKIQRLP